MMCIRRATLALCVLTLYPLNAWADPCKTAETKAKEALAELVKADSDPGKARALAAASESARDACLKQNDAGDARTTEAIKTLENKGWDEQQVKAFELALKRKYCLRIPFADLRAECERGKARVKKACKDGVLSRCKGGDAAVPSEIREMIDLAQTCIDERKKRDGLYNQAAERARKTDRVPPKLRKDMVDYILHDDGDHDASITQTQAMLDDCKEKLKTARTKKTGKKTKPTQADIAKVRKVCAPELKSMCQFDKRLSAQSEWKRDFKCLHDNRRRLSTDCSDTFAPFHH